MQQASSPMKMDRFRSILDTVNARKTVSLSDLEKILNVSRVTVQRDLVELESSRHLKRFHGGAMSMEHSNRLYDHGTRKTIHVDIKRKIAQKAVKLIRDGQHIGMDASSTVYFMSECLLPNDLLIVTCGIDTFNNLSGSSHLRPLLTGGRLNRQTNTLAGPEAVDMIRKFHFDIIFLSAISFLPEQGFYDPYEDEVQIKRAFIESSTKTVMLLDSSKIAHTGGLKVCDYKDVDFLVADDPSNKELKSQFGKRLI